MFTIMCLVVSDRTRSMNQHPLPCYRANRELKSALCGFSAGTRPALFLGVT